MRLVAIIVLMLITVYVKAQQVDYNTIILPGSAKGIDFEEVLVRLAWQNNPQNEILKERLAVAESELIQARWKWLEQIRVTGNLNEFTINPTPENADRAAFFPRYNISAYFTLGNFVFDPQEAKLKRHERSIAEESINGQKLALRAEVLRRYQIYLTDQELLRIQGENVTNVQSMYQLAEQKFSRGEITLENFNSVSDRYNAEKMKMANYESSIKISKINLEELIGVNLEDVIR